MKHTHMGDCQVCNGRHKTTSDAIVRHTCTLPWGTFTGVCLGSDLPPYQRSCTLIPGQIATVRNRISEIEAKALRTERDLVNVWVQESVPARKIKGHKLPAHFTWRNLPIRDLLELGSVTRWVGFNFLEQQVRVYPVTEQPDDTVGPDAYARSLNAIRAADYRRDIMSMMKYVNWLHDRHTRWLLTPLSPV